MHILSRVLFFFNDTATTEIYTLSLHDALPICSARTPAERMARTITSLAKTWRQWLPALLQQDRVWCPSSSTSVPQRHLWGRDRKSTRLNSSHSQISYAVFCLKKKITNDKLQFR